MFAAAVLGGLAGFGIADKLILGAADLFLSLPWLFLLLMVRAFLPLNVSPMIIGNDHILIARNAGMGERPRKSFGRRCENSTAPISCCKPAPPVVRGCSGNI